MRETAATAVNSVVIHVKPHPNDLAFCAKTTDVDRAKGEESFKAVSFLVGCKYCWSKISERSRSPLH